MGPRCHDTHPRERVFDPGWIDHATLRSPVARAIGRDTVELVNWRSEAIHTAFNQATGGLYRISGTGRDRGETGVWSVILKVVQASGGPVGGSDDPSHANYWRREPLIYQSGLLAQLPGLRAPRCFGVEQPDAATAWIWLEDVADAVGPPWSATQYSLAARRLGEFNGAYLAGRPLPTAPCLSRDWLRAFVATFAAPLARLSSLRDHPMVRRCWPDGLLDRVLRLWQEREAFFAALERLPQTFCHGDAFPRNLLLTAHTDTVVAIDWAYAGIGAVGADLAPMVAASVCFYDVEPEQAWGIDAVIWDGYLQGLEAAGWRGDPDLARLGYTAAAALRYGLIPVGVLVLDEAWRAHLERVWGHPATAIVDRWARLAHVLHDQADQARHLLRAIASRR
jgi:hypothetical protein